MAEEIIRRGIQVHNKTALMKMNRSGLVEILQSDDAGRDGGGGENLEEENFNMELGALDGQLGDLEVDSDDTLESTGEDLEMRYIALTRIKYAYKFVL